MMNRIICVVACFALSLSVASSTVSAGSYYGVNLHHYKKSLRLQRVVARRQINQMYPTFWTQLGDRSLNFLDTNVLRTDGPLDRVVNELADRLVNESGDDTTEASVAKTPPSPNAELLAILKETEEIREKLGIPVDTAVQSPDDPQALKTHDYSFLGDEVSLPAGFRFSR